MKLNLMITNKIYAVIIILSSFLFLGFKKYEKPYIMLSSGSIINENAIRTEKIFSPSQRINVGLIAPDGFKDGGIRLQISKQDEKTSNWGFSIIQSRDIYIDKSLKLYKDCIYIYRPGRYILQFFYIDKKNYPFAHYEFSIKN